MSNLKSQKEGGEKIFEEIMVENFPNLIKKKKNQPMTQESQRTPCWINTNKTTVSHITAIL